jgi:HEAT repeat protein
VRLQAVIALSGLPNPPRDVVQTLIHEMDDSDPEVASYAIRLLSRLDSQSDLVVPAIIKRLKPSDSVRIRTQLDALAHFGPRARSAIPAILQIMDKPAPPSIWIAASNAVWRIDPRALQK